MKKSKTDKHDNTAKGNKKKFAVHPKDDRKLVKYKEATCDKENYASINSEIEEKKISDSLEEISDKEKKKIEKGILAISISSTITMLIVVALVINLLAPDLYRRVFYSTPIDRGGVVMTIGNYDVMADEYTSDLLAAASVYEAQYGRTYWHNNPNQEIELLHDLGKYYIERYTLLIWADEIGVQLTSEETAEVDVSIETMITAIGGRDAFAKSMSKSYMTEELYYRLAYIDARLRKFEQALVDGAIGTITTEDIKQSLDGKGIICAKHILFATTGDEVGDAAQKHLAETVLSRIRAGEDFDALMQEYSGDPGLADHPDGYTFGPGEMILEFENAAKELEVGEISDVIETVYGYHIIRRLEVNYDDFYKVVFTERYNEKLLEMASSISVTYGRGYENIRIGGVRWAG